MHYSSRSGFGVYSSFADREFLGSGSGDCKEDAEFVARQVEKKMGVHNILINCIGTVIGSHTGPGVVAVFCMGNKR